ncbi:MAG: leucine-rich repeat protein [Candidatus Onthovivens sp.]
MEENKNKRRKRRIVIFTLSSASIILLLGLFGCKKINDSKTNNKIYNSLPKLSEEGYWKDKDNNKITDKKIDNNNHNVNNSYDYYKSIDKDYKKSLSEFKNDLEDQKLPYKFKVEFYNDNKLLDSREYNFLDKLVYPLDPKKVDHTFKGWKLLDSEANKDILFTSANPIAVDNNLKFESVFIKNEVPLKTNVNVNFYVDNDLYKEFEVKVGDKISSFDAPNKEDHLFLGWYDQFGNKFDFDKEVKVDLNLKAKYFNIKAQQENIKKHHVNFLDEDGNIYQTSEVANFDKVSAIRGKNKVGHHFVRWLNQDDLTPFDFDSQIVKDYNLVPEYEINKYKVEFVGSDIENLPGSYLDVEHGKTLAAPDTSSMKKVGHHFINQYKDQNDNEFIFGTTKVESNLKLTPIFEINKYKITFKANPDFVTLPSEINDIEHGSKVNKPDLSSVTCVDAGYELSGLFYLDNGVKKEFKFNETIVTSDLELSLEKKIKRHIVTIEDHEGNVVSTSEVNHYSEVSLKKYSTDYVYDYYFNKDKEDEHYSDDADTDNFKYVVVKNITLKAKGHKKHIKFITNEAKISREVVINKYDEEEDEYYFSVKEEILGTNIIEIKTGDMISFPKVTKEGGYYRVKPTVWQYRDEDGNLQDYNETTYSSNFDTELYLKNEAELFDDLFTFSYDNEGIEDIIPVVWIEGFNDKYKTILQPELIIPTMINDYPVKHVSGFNNCTNIKNVTFSPTYKDFSITLDNSCFKDSSIENIDLEQSRVKEISHKCFANCANLQSIKFPNTLGYLGLEAFENCVNISSIDLSKTKTKYILSKTFKNCTKLKNVILNTSIIKIDYKAFENCTKLENINIEDTKTEQLGSNAFESCSSLKKIVFPETLTNEPDFTNLSMEAFMQCKALEKADLSKTKLENLATNMFKNCTNLKLVKLPSTLKYLKNFTFKNCSSLETIEFDGTQSEFRHIIITSNVFEGVTSNPEIKFNDGTSIHLNDL